MERMKNLEIERLKGELDEKDGEISRLEKLVGEGNKVIAGHAQRVSLRFSAFSPPDAKVSAGDLANCPSLIDIDP
jgi:hypothetical protein